MKVDWQNRGRTEDAEKIARGMDFFYPNDVVTEILKRWRWKNFWDKKEEKFLYQMTIII